MLKSLRELLLRKAVGDKKLQMVLRLADEEMLADGVLESLEKMADSKADPQANASLLRFTKDVGAEVGTHPEYPEPKFVTLLRDAMGHHASAYRNALHSGDEATADKHAQMFIKYGDLANKMQRIDKNILTFKAPALHPWQYNHPNFRNNKKEKFSKDGKLLPGKRPYDETGWRSHYKQDRNGYHPDDLSLHHHENPHDDNKIARKGIVKAPFDFSWLRRAPHADKRQEIKQDTSYVDENGKTKYANGPYPMERAKINDRYITIHEGASGPHPLDSHPIVKVFHKSDSEHGAYEAQKYEDDETNFLASTKDQLRSFLKRGRDPEAGKKPGPSVHDSIKNPPELDVEENIGKRLSQQVEEPAGNILDFLEDLPDETPARHKGEVSKDIEGLIGVHPEHPEFSMHMADKAIQDPSIMERFAPLHQEWHAAPEAPKQRSLEDIKADLASLDFSDPASSEKMKPLMEELKALNAGKR